MRKKTKLDIWEVLSIALVITVILAFYCVAKAHAETVPANLWKGLVGEAVSEGPEGMYAVACCVRNRLEAGMDTGLCALKRRDLDKFVRSEGKRVETMAKRIVERVFKEKGPDVTRGAHLYENIKKYGFPKTWDRRKVRYTCTVGEHQFYQEIGRRKRK